MGQMMTHAHANADHLRPAALEPRFWKMLKQICMLEGVTCSEVVANMNDLYGEQKLASVVRVFILNYYLPCRVDHNGPSAPGWKHQNSKADSGLLPPT